jgi:hypothetical protein
LQILKELYQLRDEVNEKEDILYDKNSQIKLYQNNIDNLTREIEKLSQQRQSEAMFQIAPGRQAHDEEELRKVMNAKRRSMLEQNNVALFFDKNVIKPIRGGSRILNKIIINDVVVDSLS